MDLGIGAILGAFGQAFTNLSSTVSFASKYRTYRQFTDVNGQLHTVPAKDYLPLKPNQPIIQGVSAGLIRKASPWVLEVIQHGISRSE